MNLDDDISRIKEIADQRESVVFAVLFGSAAQGELHSVSDIDVAVKLSQDDRIEELGELNFDLNAATDHDVDTVDFERLKLHIAAEAVNNGRLISGDECAFKEFRQKINQDFDKATHKQKQQDIIDRAAQGEFDV